MDEMEVGALLSLSWIRREVGWGGRLFEAGRLLTFSAFRMGAYSRLGAYSNKYGLLILFRDILLPINIVIFKCNIRCVILSFEQ